MRPALFLALALSAPLFAQEGDRAEPAKLHPYLQKKIREVGQETLLPAYFVMREKLPYEHFFPRVWRLDKETRRTVVVRELKEHMERTQRELHAFLEKEAARGCLAIVSRNYLGNFIRVQAPASILMAGAAFPSVAEVWYDYTPPLAEVEDSPAPIPAPAPLPAAGNGPQDTRADLVWAKGITGKGVVWMNSDSGVRASQTTAGDVHPGFKGRLWINPGETFNNNQDDDKNGKVDDYFGWNFGSNNNTIDDRGGHGTSVTGVFVGVEHTNQTILGNCPDARMMTGRLSGESSQWDAIQYAIDMGAHGQTSSHSYKNNFNPPPNYKMHRDVGEKSLAAGLIRTNSTSNNGSACGSSTSTVRRPYNISAPGCLPCPWMHPDQKLVGRLGGALGIGAHNVGTTTQPSYTPCGPFAWHLTDLLTVLPSFPTGNWDSVNDNDYPWSGGQKQGLLKPDLTGPTGTRTTSSSTSYRNFSGTSNATPSVSSCLALALSANMSLTPEDMAMAAQVTARDYGAVGKDNKSGTGRVDAWELTKMARAIHRVKGRVDHTVPVKVSAPNTWDLELDSIPNTFVILLFDLAPGSTQIGQFTLRLANVIPLVGTFTDAKGNLRVTYPTFPALAGHTVYTQFAVADPLFGPVTGSNAVATSFVK